MGLKVIWFNGFWAPVAGVSTFIMTLPMGWAGRTMCKHRVTNDPSEPEKKKVN